jgi:uncharacterized protein (TIGR00369 family)
MSSNNKLIIDFLKNIDSPFDKKLGVKLVEAKKGRVVIELRTKKSFTNSNGVIHGGLTASLCDAAMGASVMTFGINSVTVEMKVNYLSPGGPDGKFIAIGRVVKKGHTLVIAESEVYYKNKLIAKSLGTYFVEHPKENIV